MIQINVNGVFAEDFKETNLRPVFRSFCRSFCIVPVGSGWSIMNDMLFITVVSDELLIVRKIGVYLISEIKFYFSITGINKTILYLQTKANIFKKK